MTTIMGDGKVSVKLAASILGHTDTETTGNVYTHSSEGAERAAMALFRKPWECDGRKRVTVSVTVKRPIIC